MLLAEVYALLVLCTAYTLSKNSLRGIPPDKYCTWKPQVENETWLSLNEQQAGERVKIGNQ